MNQSEADEISDAFIDAWKEYFGTKMYYVTLDLSKTKPDSLYGEQKVKIYDFDNKLSFYGTLTETPAIDEEKQAGKKVNKDYEISLVTKQLVDQGVTEIDQNAIIQYIDRFGKEHLFRIYDDYQKVQFSDNKIFTNFKVIPKSG